MAPAILAMGFAYGGLAQIIAGILEWKKGNNFTSVAFISYGCFAGGVVDPAAELQEPIYTGLLIDWTSALFFATIISTVLFAIWQFLGLLKTNAKEALSSLAVLVLFVALLFVTYTVGDDTPLQGLNADSQQYNTAGWLKISDMWILSTFTLICEPNWPHGVLVSMPST